MWRWDQGGLSYFQFDSLKAMARLALAHDWKTLEKPIAVPETGLPFLPDKPGYEKPWRNYSRTLKRGMIVYDDGTRAVPTPLAELLAGDGLVTADEYFHFIARTFTDPSPALQGWDPATPRRYPLVFALRYGLAKLVEGGMAEVALDEVLRAYSKSKFLGDEDYSQFAALVASGQDAEGQSRSSDPRQARESLKAISQISYLHYDGQALAFSLDTRDSKRVFDQWHPINAWLREESRSDFESMGQAREVYGTAKTRIGEAAHAQ